MSSEKNGIDPFDFTNNEMLKESGFGIEGKTVDGYVTKDGITLNINSHKALNYVVGHEITHVLEGTDLYAQLQTALAECAKAKGEYDSRRANIEELYRNVFLRIYDEIKYLLKQATAGSDEARRLEKAKKIFDDVYRKGGKNTLKDGEVKYAFGVTQEDIDSFVDAAYTNENVEDYKKYAEVSQRLKDDVQADVNIDGYVHALRDNDLRHIRNSHGEATKEKYPVTKQDLKNIPWIVENYDKVFVVKRGNGKVGLMYVKVNSDGLIYYLEQVTTKYGNERLLINKQMIKTGIDDIPGLPGLKDAITKKQSETEFLNDLKQIQQVYAQSVYQFHSTDKVAQDSKNVNHNSDQDYMDAVNTSISEKIGNDTCR